MVGWRVGFGWMLLLGGVGLEFRGVSDCECRLLALFFGYQ
jgi:hypothetical protein